MRLTIKVPSKLWFRFKLAGLQNWLQQRWYTYKYVGRHVRLSDKYIKNWVLSHANWEATQGPTACELHQFHADVDYDQQILLAMFMLMREPVYGVVKAPGCDAVLCYFVHEGCSEWTYVEPKDLVFLD